VIREVKVFLVDGFDFDELAAVFALKVGGEFMDGV
jgi:hypothetical protein